MRVIFGIGNPGIRYEYTRHNAGFLLLDHFAQKKLLRFEETTGEYLKAFGKVNDKDFVLVKPVTFVNNSGIAAKQIFDQYVIEPEDFLVICDDLKLQNFALRVRLSGGDGGHNGLSSIIYHLGTEKFPRIRIGIGGNPENTTLSEYVLTEFTGTELKNLTDTFQKSVLLIEEFIIGGLKKMLEANSVIIKSENQNNSNQTN